jgi:hypothetical protein
MSLRLLDERNTIPLLRVLHLFSKDFLHECVVNHVISEGKSCRKKIYFAHEVEVWGASIIDGISEQTENTRMDEEHRSEARHAYWYIHHSPLHML